MGFPFFSRVGMVNQRNILSVGGGLFLLLYGFFPASPTAIPFSFFLRIFSSSVLFVEISFLIHIADAAP